MAHPPDAPVHSSGVSRDASSSGNRARGRISGSRFATVKRALGPGGVSDGRVAVLIFLGVAVAYWLALPHVDIQANHPSSDGSIYRIMAEHPGKLHVPGVSTPGFSQPWEPFIFRVLTPWTVWALPFSTQTGFALLNVLGVAGSAAVLFLYARTFFDRAAAFRAVAYFVIAGNVLMLLMDPWLVDGPAFLVSVLSFLLVRRGRLGWAAVTLSIGVAAHESLVIVLVTLVFAHLVENKWRFDVRLIPLVGLPILVYVVIRQTSLLYGSTLPTYEFWGAANRAAVLRTRRALDGNLVKSVFFAFATSFGGLWALAVLSFRRSPRFLRATSVMLPLVGLNFLTAADWDRVLTVTFPVVIVLACRVRLRWAVLVAFLGVQAWISGLAIDRITGYYTGHLNHPHYKLTIALAGIAVALALLGAATSRGPGQGVLRTSARL